LRKNAGTHQIMPRPGKMSQKEVKQLKRKQAHHRPLGGGGKRVKQEEKEKGDVRGEKLEGGRPDFQAKTKDRRRAFVYM